MSMTTMTSEQAYAAMYFFLDDLYSRSPSDAVGGLLSSMALLEDGRPADSAIVADWERAVKKAMKEGKAGRLEFK